MHPVRRPGLTALCLVTLAFGAAAGAGADKPAAMKFNDVKEVAPGVFFRYSAISPTDPSVFGGSNNIWVVFEDYVAVVDANFPKEAQDVLDAIKKTTDKPVRYVLDTHHHGDHAYGNAVFGKAGAQVVAQTNCARLLRVNGPREFAEAGRGPTGRKDVASGTLKTPNIVFDDKLVLEDGTQRVEFLFLGHAHTAGDAVAYLPRHKILCTGDACVNGAFNFMGHSDSASWVRTLERMQQLDVKLICPGHGPPAGPELLANQKRYFVELRREVLKGIDAGKTAEEIADRIDFPWYKEWTSVRPAGDNVKHVYGELTGRVSPWDLSEEYGVLEGPSPTKATPGWKAPRRIVVPSGLMPAKLQELKGVAPEVEFLPAKNVEAAVRLAADADAVVGAATAEVLRAGKNVRWIQLATAAPEPELTAEAAKRLVVLTDTEGVDGPPAADQAFAQLLTLAAGNGKGAGPRELHSKTLVVVGLGGTGTQVARRAHAFGMRVWAVDARATERPSFVFRLDRPEKLPDLLPAADVVVLACPLTEATRGLIGGKQLAAMKKGALLVNAGRPSLVDAAAVAAALKDKRLGGAGLTAGERDAAARELAGMPNVTVAQRPAGQTAEARERRWRLLRENVRRFAAGEPLLCVLEPAAKGAD